MRVVDAIEEKQTPLEELLKMKVFPKFFPQKLKPTPTTTTTTPTTTPSEQPLTITAAVVHESVEISVLK